MEILDEKENLAPSFYHFRLFEIDKILSPKSRHIHKYIYTYQKDYTRPE